MTNKSEPEGRRPKRPKPKPMSEVAALIRGGKDDRSTLPILADWLEERLGLSATAALLRLPDIREVDEEPHYTGEFNNYPLAEDAFLWFAQGRRYPQRGEGRFLPCTLIGLYAHPDGRPADWVKWTSLLIHEPQPTGTKAARKERGTETDPRVATAWKELADFISRPGP